MSEKHLVCAYGCIECGNRHSVENMAPTCPMCVHKLRSRIVELERELAVMSEACKAAEDSEDRLVRERNEAIKFRNEYEAAFVGEQKKRMEVEQSRDYLQEKLGAATEDADALSKECDRLQKELDEALTVVATFGVGPSYIEGLQKKLGEAALRTTNAEARLSRAVEALKKIYETGVDRGLIMSGIAEAALREIGEGA